MNERYSKKETSLFKTATIKDFTLEEAQRLIKDGNQIPEVTELFNGTGNEVPKFSFQLDENAETHASIKKNAEFGMIIMVKMATQTSYGMANIRISDVYEEVAFETKHNLIPPLLLMSPSKLQMPTYMTAEVDESMKLKWVGVKCKHDIPSYELKPEIHITEKAINRMNRNQLLLSLGLLLVALVQAFGN